MEETKTTITTIKINQRKDLWKMLWNVSKCLILHKGLTINNFNIYTNNATATKEVSVETYY